VRSALTIEESPDRHALCDDYEPIPDGVGEGPIAVIGGDSSGWAVCLKDSVRTLAYNYPGPEFTHIRGTDPLPAGRHLVPYEFEKTGGEPIGARGTGRLFVGDETVAEGEIKRPRHDSPATPSDEHGATKRSTPS
jgi:hypothetical protein